MLNGSIKQGQYFCIAVYIVQIPRHPWLIALAVCFWIPLYNIISTGDFETLLSILPGFAGAYTGFYAKKYFERSGS